MKMYWLFALDRDGNTPDRYFYILDLVLWIAVKTMFFFSLFLWCLCCLQSFYFFMCPRLLRIDFARCNFTLLTDRFGHILKKPFSITAIQVDFVGPKHAVWYQLMNYTPPPCHEYVVIRRSSLLFLIVFCFIVSFCLGFCSVIWLLFFLFWFWRSSQLLVAIILWSGSYSRVWWFYFIVTVMVCVVRLIMHTSSQIFPRETSAT